MIPISKFAKSYLTMQGVLILPESRVISKPVQDREKEDLPIVAMYERGDLP